MNLDKLKAAHLGVEMKVITPSEFDLEAWNGRMLTFEPPEPGELYALGVDPAEGVRGDRSVCQVIKLGNMKHPDVQVAEFACDFLDPVDFAQVVNSIGRFYSGPDGEEAFLTLETNAPCGDSMIGELRFKLDYGNLYIRRSYDKLNSTYTNTFGWSTNKASRPKLIARGLHALQYGDLLVNSPYLLDEMSDFRRDKFDEKPEARTGRHDDRIMSILMGYYGSHEDEWLGGDDIGEQRRASQRVDDIIEEKAVEVIGAAARPDYQNRQITMKDMYSDWENRFFNEID